MRHKDADCEGCRYEYIIHAKCEFCDKENYFELPPAEWYEPIDRQILRVLKLVNNKLDVIIRGK